MPEHVHLLILPRRAEEISSILRACKQPVTEKAKSYLSQSAPAGLTKMADPQPSGRISYRFWQRGGGYDRNIISAEETYEKLDYIHHNPVRAGLVEHPREWTWSSYRAWHESEAAPISVGREDFPVSLRPDHGHRLRR